MPTDEDRTIGGVLESPQQDIDDINGIEQCEELCCDDAELTRDAENRRVWEDNNRLRHLVKVRTKYLNKVREDRNKARKRAIELGVGLSNAGTTVVVLRRKAEKLEATLALFYHAHGCDQCRGPDDGCDKGKILESVCVDDLNFDPYQYADYNSSLPRKG